MAEQATQFAVSRGAPGASSTAPFGVFERMLAMRYLRARRKEGFISVIAGFSFLGIVLGVATLIIVMAVMNGFRTELLSKILGMNGHLVLQPIDRPLDDYDALSQSIAQIDGRRARDALCRRAGAGLDAHAEFRRRRARADGGGPARHRGGFRQHRAGHAGRVRYLPGARHRYPPRADARAVAGRQADPCQPAWAP